MRLWRPPCGRYYTSGIFDFYTCPGHDPVLPADCATCPHNRKPAVTPPTAPPPEPPSPPAPAPKSYPRRPKHPPVNGKPVANWGFWEDAFAPGQTNLDRAKQLIAEGHTYLGTERLLGGPTRTLGRRLKRDQEKLAKKTP